ncbi:hypothetical protein [Epilithonimonas sp.]|uniref:hypothetical protein n=1 Tax=Epilithonimonas sp. TaxID=2894511 RepID=UPI0028A140A9|nr:hypothetical protein [Epilithonimonas sp.]
MVLTYSELSAKDMRKNDLNGKGDAGVGAKSVYIILLYRDANKDGGVESSSIFIDNLNQRYGMLIIKNQFYISKNDGL